MIKINKLQGLQIAFQILTELERLAKQQQSEEAFQCMTSQDAVMSREGFYITAEDHRDRSVIVHSMPHHARERYGITVGRPIDFDGFTKAVEGTVILQSFWTAEAAAQAALDWLTGKNI